MVIVTDDESRENEGDLVMAASKVTPEAINHMILHGRGLICSPLLPNQLGRLGISSMVPHNREAQKTDFTVSVDAADGITTGISAFDRSRTIRILCHPILPRRFSATLMFSSTSQTGRGAGESRSYRGGCGFSYLGRFAPKWCNLRNT